MSWLERPRALWGNARLWLVLGALLTRGVGFIASFVIGRLAGPVALGMYSATVNTSASVAMAGIGVLANATTVNAGEAGSAFSLRRLLMAYLAWIGLATLAMMLVLYGALSLSGMFEQARAQALSPVWLFVVTALVMVGSLLTSAVSGLLMGTGDHLPMARLQSLAAMVLMAMSVPVVYWGGLHGALVFAAVTAGLPALLSLLLAWRIGGTRRVGGSVSTSAWQVAGAHLRASAPNALALVSTAAVTWLCTIYLTQHAHGVAGVAAVAVANQWLTVMLMPATSWGGVLIKELLAHHRFGSHAVDWPVLRGMVRHNVAVTGGIAVAVALASGLIARAYGLEDLALRDMVLINALAAVVGTALAVPERVLVCQGRQGVWLCVSLVGLSCQLLVVWSGIDHALWVVPLGTLLSQAVVLLLALGWLRMTASEGT